MLDQWGKLAIATVCLLVFGLLGALLLAGGGAAQEGGSSPQDSHSKLESQNSQAIGITASNSNNGFCLALVCNNNQSLDVRAEAINWAAITTKGDCNAADGVFTAGPIPFAEVDKISADNQPGTCAPKAQTQTATEKPGLLEQATGFLQTGVLPVVALVVVGLFVVLGIARSLKKR